MIIYLMQHGKCMTKEENPDRPLNHEGVRETNEMASVIKRFELKVDAIYHSPKVRAKETAELIIGAVHSNRGLVERDDLNPNDDVKKFRDLLISEGKDAIIIGHLPFLDRLVTFLLYENDDTGAVLFKNSGLLCLEQQEESHFALKWLITPQLIDML